MRADLQGTGKTEEEREMEKRKRTWERERAREQSGKKGTSGVLGRW